MTTIDFLPSGAGIVPRPKIGVAEREYPVCDHAQTCIEINKHRSRSLRFTLKSLAEIELPVGGAVAIRSRVVGDWEMACISITGAIVGQLEIEAFCEGSAKVPLAGTPRTPVFVSTSDSAIVCSWTGGNSLATAQSERSSREEVGERIVEGEFDDDCPCGTGWSRKACGTDRLSI